MGKINGQNKGKNRARGIDHSENLKVGMFKPGQSGNPKGRPRGARDYITVFREAITKLADQNGATLSEFEEKLLQVGFRKALSGDARFYQDVLDRSYGKAVQRTEITGLDGKDLFDGEQDEKAKKAIDEFTKRNPGKG
jgi:hypothetical protein